MLKQGNGQSERIARTIIGGRWTIKGGGIGWIGPSLDNCRMTTVVNHREWVSLFDKAECSSEQATRKTMFFVCLSANFSLSLSKWRQQTVLSGTGIVVTWKIHTRLGNRRRLIYILYVHWTSWNRKLTLIKKTRCIAKYSYCMFIQQGFAYLPFRYGSTSIPE